MTRREDPREHREHLRSAEGLSLCFEWPPGERTFLLGLAEGTFSLHVEPEDMFHFDLEGRLRRAFTGGRNYLRGMDGAVLRKIAVRGKRATGGRDPVEPGEVGDIFRLTHTQVRQGLDSLESVWAEVTDSLPALRMAEEVRDLLRRAVRFTPEQLVAETARFRDVYAPLSILPPDRYRALILQATIGCSYGQCAFCTLYRDVEYRQKSVDEFRQHARKVKDLFGRALRLKGGVFLAEANALEMSFADLLGVFGVVHEEFPDQVTPSRGRRGGISAFTDVFQGRFKCRAELEQLRDLGLDRLYLGIESGDDSVLRGLKKPGSRAAAAERVRCLKEAGVSVGAIFLVGAGGRRARRSHVDNTVSLVESLALGRDDIVYLSPLQWHDRPPPRTDELRELEEEEQELTTRLRALGARVSRYDLRSFVYY